MRQHISLIALYIRDQRNIKEKKNKSHAMLKEPVGVHVGRSKRKCILLERTQDIN